MKDTFYRTSLVVVTVCTLLGAAGGNALAGLGFALAVIVGFLIVYGGGKR